jgi:hypothetical protein
VAYGHPPVAAQFAAEELVVFVCGEQDEIGVAVEEHVSAIVAVYPQDRRPHVVLPALHRPVRRIGGGTVGTVELVLEKVCTAGGIGRRSGRREKVRRVGPGLLKGDSGGQRTEPGHQHHVATIHLRHDSNPRGISGHRARFTDGFCHSD